MVKKKTAKVSKKVTKKAPSKKPITTTTKKKVTKKKVAPKKTAKVTKKVATTVTKKKALPKKSIVKKKALPKKSQASITPTPITAAKKVKDIIVRPAAQVPIASSFIKDDEAKLKENLKDKILGTSPVGLPENLDDFEDDEYGERAAGGIDGNGQVIDKTAGRVDDYNPDDEPVGEEEDEYGYGWDYDNGLDDPEEEIEENYDDEDEAYARENRYSHEED